MFGVLRLARYLKNYKKECILGPIFKFIEVIFELLLPTIMALIVNEGVGRQDLPYVLRMGGLMVLLSLCGYASALVCQRMASRASQGFGTVLRDEVFRRILAFSSAQLDRFGAPTLTNRLTNDVNQLQQMVAMSIRLLSRAPFICIGSILMAFLLDRRLALILLCATPVLALIIYVITKHSAPLYRTYQAKLDGLGDVLRENLSGVRVIRAFSKTKQEVRRFRDADGSLTETGFSIGRWAALFNPLTSLAVNWMIVAVLWAGSLRIQAGALSQGQIIALINYAGQILAALLVLSNMVILITRSMASAARINELLDTEPEMAAPERDPEEDAAAPAVEFREVSFGYSRSERPALEHISLIIRRGETVGVIGGTGSGKTALINLIARFYSADEGTVLVNGAPVENYPPATLRRKIGFAPQKAVLFTGTVAENLRWGREDASREEIESAARTAQAEEFIRALPEGYESMLRRGGENLSGGQRQRLSIARALAVRPEILILDDATSALDFLTEARLRQALREEDGKRTVLMVSQRVSTVRDADRILVLDDGRLVGNGTHEELYQSCESYREICDSQLSEEEAAI